MRDRSKMRAGWDGDGVAFFLAPIGCDHQISMFEHRVDDVF